MRVIIAFLGRNGLGCHTEVTRMEFYAVYGRKRNYHEILELVGVDRSYDAFEFGPETMFPQVPIKKGKIVDEA